MLQRKKDPNMPVSKVLRLYDTILVSDPSMIQLTLSISEATSTSKDDEL